MVGKVEKWVRDKVLGPVEGRGSDPHAETDELNDEPPQPQGGDK